MPNRRSDTDIVRAKVEGAVAPLGAVGAGAREIVRQAMAAFGLFLILFGTVIGFLTPFLPIGSPIAIVGIVLLGRNSRWGKRWMESVLKRHPKIERFAPGWLMKLVFGRAKVTPS